MADSFFINTKLLLRCNGNGTDGSTDIVDESFSPKTVTVYGNAHISTTDKKYGTGGVVFDGTGDYLSIGTAADFKFMHLTGAKWTFETWGAVTDFTAQRTLFSTNGGSRTYSGVNISVSTTTRKIYFEIDRGVTSTSVIEGAFATALPNDSVLHHIEIAYDNSLATDNATLYIDGVASGTLSKTAYACSSANPQTAAIVGGVGATGNFKGGIDDMRITDAVIRHTGDFTPPTEELPTSQAVTTGTASLHMPVVHKYDMTAYDEPTNSYPLLDTPRGIAVGYGGATAQLHLPMPVLTFHPGAGAQLTMPKPTLTAYAGASAHLTITRPNVHAQGHDATGENDASLTMPAARLTAYGGANAKLNLPKPALSITATVVNLGSAAISTPRAHIVATGTVGRVGHAALSAPMATLSAYGGANASLSAPSATLAITALPGAVGRAALEAPVPTLSSFGGGQARARTPSATLSATGTAGNVGHAALSIKDYFTATGYGGAVAAVSMSAPTLTASGTAGNVGHASLHWVGLYELTATGSEQNHGGASLLMPMPRLVNASVAYLIAPRARLTAVGHALVSSTYEAYSLNLSKPPGFRPEQQTEDNINEITRYTNYPFERIVRYKNSYFGMTADGLFLLEGPDDDGTATAYHVQTALTDFDKPNKKTAESVYLGGRFGPSATITWIGGENGTNSYTYTTPRDQYAQNYRQVLGKGIKERYYALSIAGDTALELDSLEFNLATLARRI